MPEELGMYGPERAFTCQWIYLPLRYPKPPQRADHEDLEPAYGRRSVTWSGGSAGLIL